MTIPEKHSVKLADFANDYSLGLFEKSQFEDLCQQANSRE